MNGSFDFDLKSLEIFVYTVDSGNMTLAAERLGTTQSAVSQNLANLEKSLQVKLLDRTVRPLEMTTAGRFFYDSATKMLTLAQKTNEDMHQSKFSHLDHVNIAMVDSLVTALGPSLIAALKGRATSWSVNTGLSHLHANALLSRHVDMILSDDALEEHAELKRYRILREPFVLVLPKGHQGQVEHLPKLLKTLGLIRYSANSLIGITVERYLKRMSVEPPVSLRLDNTFAILSSVAAGLGWTITTPLCLFQNGIRHLELDCYPLPGEPLYRNLTLVSRHNELWELPKVIADDSRIILQDNFLGYVEQHLSWLDHEIKIG
ncbi:LysR family transcriptional regulator [Thalassomonas actiniarum]|uniref:LysR family transcriptional regulator n=1 Tax=Thalassomonas actiniarum TaxID=485447 RepID=A0AAE9YJJ8_9GAMM|nr:LysR family transcriptional regulator [Thalassomonas actiniarum]WDD96945.1 LysR family transcriptional regulator [Thalassomonas actiniarum]